MGATFTWGVAQLDLENALNKATVLALFDDGPPVAGIINAVTPLATIVATFAAFPSERPTAGKVAGILVSLLCGVLRPCRRLIPRPPRTRLAPLRSLRRLRPRRQRPSFKAALPCQPIPPMRSR